jgi:S-DNA-T family DNA segregation ATPase FtsK/SpoIIIE
MHLDIIVTEAKFVTHDGLAGAASASAKQLLDTLSQMTEAMDGEARTIDQDIWLARLSDLVASQDAVAPGLPPLDTVAWRRAIRQRQCTVSIWGYSRVFVHEPLDSPAQVSTVKGIANTKGRAKLDAPQEIFGPGHVRELILQFGNSDFRSTAELRLRNGHPAFGKSKLYSLASTAESKTRNPKEEAAGVEVVDQTDSVKGSQPVPVLPEAQNAGPAAEPAPNVESVADSEADALIAFLESRARLHKSSEEAGQAWLETITGHLRQALISRGLPAKLIEGVSPILTPNSGIIKLQGSKELTVQAVDSRADEIYTSDASKSSTRLPNPVACPSPR